MFDFTVAPWEVETGGQPGEYFISGVAHEQASYLDEGYDISQEEGDRRAKIANTRDENNRRLIQAAPVMYASCKAIVESWEKGGLAQAARKCQAVIDELEGGERDADNHREEESRRR